MASCGEGYYHLLTKPAYIVMYKNTMKVAPNSFCPCFLSVEARQDIKDHEDVLEILLLRTRASIPDDAQAAKDAVTKGQNECLGDL